MDGIGVKVIAKGFFLFLGSAFDLIPNASQNQKIIITGGLILFVTGLIIAIYHIFNSKLFKKQRNLNHTELFILGSIMFLIGTALVVTFTRISYGEAGLLTSRYKIYSILLSITVYIAFISKINANSTNWLAISLLFMAFCFNFMANFSNFKEVVNFRNQLISFAINWKMGENISAEKLTISLYNSPELSLENNILEIKKPIKNAQILKESFLKIKKSDGILIQNDNLNSPSDKEDNISLIVQSMKKTYFMPTQLMNYPLKAYLRTGQYWQKGFIGILNNNEFENGTYQLGLFIKRGQNIQKYYLNDSLMINNRNANPLKTNW